MAWHPQRLTCHLQAPWGRMDGDKRGGRGGTAASHPGFSLIAAVSLLSGPWRSSTLGERWKDLRRGRREGGGSEWTSPYPLPRGSVFLISVRISNLASSHLNPGTKVIRKGGKAFKMQSHLILLLISHAFLTNFNNWLQIAEGIPRFIICSLTSLLLNNKWYMIWYLQGGKGVMEI